MNPPKCDELDYIHFLVAAQKVFTCTEAARCQSQREAAPAHDAFTRLLQRVPLDTETLWQESKQLIRREEGYLVLDDTTLDKPYAEKMDLVTYHWSGKHHSVVKGINLLTLLWSDGVAHIPCDFHVYNGPVDGLSKNDHFKSMLNTAKERGFAPRHVLFDSWYSGLENLKLVRRLGWHFFCRLKENRLVNPTGERRGNVNLGTVEIPPEGRVVHLKGFGMVKVFKKVSKEGDVEYYATDSLEEVDSGRFSDLSGVGWRIEEYHRGVKQCCGVERAQVRGATAVMNHIGMAVRAFLRLEAFRLRTKIGWYEAKAALIRDAIRMYLAHPIYTLSPTA